MNKIRFGVIGTNFITDWVIAGAKQDERFELVAVCSRTQERANEFAAKYDIPNLLPNMIFPIHLLRWRKWRQVR